MPCPTARRALLAATLLAGPARAAEPTRRLSLAEADYVPQPKGIAMCASCSFFVRPDGCRVVAGQVSAEGWCKLFDMVD